MLEGRNMVWWGIVEEMADVERLRQHGFAPYIIVEPDVSWKQPLSLKSILCDLNIS